VFDTTSATLMGALVIDPQDDKDYGRIAVGKAADLVIVAGKPASRISGSAPRRARGADRAGVHDARSLRGRRPNAALGGIS
jgi:cytosine/adenosine deaminase-related metal-dependent hydrolase